MSKIHKKLDRIERAFKETDIVVFLKDGRVKIFDHDNCTRSCYYMSMSTKRIINIILRGHLQIVTENKKWIVIQSNKQEEYYNGIVIDLESK